mmetsp:Transcript_20684/g.32366  ORF Transcript_20684/g.32366 Transcript_20684/m.32366 type:complete len:353 (+) Transcript_20684:468-1526(+)
MLRNLLSIIQRRRLGLIVNTKRIVVSNHNNAQALQLIPSIAKKVPVIHNKSNTQMETLPVGPGNSDPPAAAEDNAESNGVMKLPSLPPVHKTVSKSKSPPSLKRSSPPAKKKVVTKPKLPTRTGHKLPVRATEAETTSEGNQEGLPSVREENVAEKVQQEQEQPEGEGKNESHAQEQEKTVQSKSMPTADDDDDDMYEEPLPGINTITPPTKNREPAVVQDRTAEAVSDPQKEARELLAMSNSMNVDARSRMEPPQQYESLKSKAAGTVTSFSNKSPSIAKVSVEGGGPPVVHKPNDFDPESIDTICAEIYERKQQNGCTKFPLCLCNQTPCAKKSLTSSLRIKKASYHGSL